MATLEEVQAALRTEAPGTIVGVDEVGLGSWAGPIVTCACAVPTSWEGDPEVKDSKMLTAAQRERIYAKYWKPDVDWMILSVGEASLEEIETLGVQPALKLAHRRAIEGTYYRLVYPPFIIVDGTVDPELGRGQVLCLPKADQHIPAVSLASIIAKVWRDRYMADLAKTYPGYGFEKHSGYGTKGHQKALQQLGVSPVHRKGYAPIRRLMEAAITQTEDIQFLLESLPQE